MNRARIASAVTVLVMMLGMLPVLAVATKLVGDGTASQFAIEPTTADYQAADAGRSLIVAGLALIACASVLSFALLRNWWIAAGLMAPAIAGGIGGLVFTVYGAGLAPSSASRSRSSEQWPASRAVRPGWWPSYAPNERMIPALSLELSSLTDIWANGLRPGQGKHIQAPPTAPREGLDERAFV